METRAGRHGCIAIERREVLNDEIATTFRFWLRTGSYAEIEGLCELIREEVTRRGQEFTWRITCPVVPASQGGTDGGTTDDTPHR